MKGVVVAPQPRAVEVGARILEAGGNAFDAAVATAFMQTVVDPWMGSMGAWEPPMRMWQRQKSTVS